MNITKDDIKKVISQMEASGCREAYHMLKELIQEQKWQPKESSCYPLGMWNVYEEMQDRNRLILQAKTEMGYGDGEYKMTFSNYDNEWEVITSNFYENPELSFKTEEQGKTVLKMVGLNET